MPQYRESVLALLDKLSFSGEATALEVGPGDGGFLPELARRFTQVTALDNSPAMLRPIGRTVYLMPPYILEPQEIADLAARTRAVFEATLWN